MTGTALEHRPHSTHERRPLGGRARRVGLTAFLTAVAVNAALGIYAVLVPDFGATEGKVLATSLCVTGAVVVALACEPAWEHGLLGPVPLVTAVVGAAGFAVVLVGIWAGTDTELWGRIVGTAFTLTAAGVVACLLVLARLAPRHRRIFRVGLALLAVAAGLVVGLVWTEDPGEWYIRVLGVALIGLAAVVVTVPVLHWVDRAELTTAEAGAASEVAFCPFCGRSLRGTAGDRVTCASCGRRFSVRAGS